MDGGGVRRRRTGAGLWLVANGLWMVRRLILRGPNVSNAVRTPGRTKTGWIGDLEHVARRKFALRLEPALDSRPHMFFVAAFLSKLFRSAGSRRLKAATTIIMFSAPSFSYGDSVERGVCLIVVEYLLETTAHRRPCKVGDRFLIGTTAISTTVKMIKNDAAIEIDTPGIVFFDETSIGRFRLLEQGTQLPIFDRFDSNYMSGGKNTPVGSISLTFTKEK